MSEPDELNDDDDGACDHTPTKHGSTLACECREIVYAMCGVCDCQCRLENNTALFDKQHDYAYKLTCRKCQAAFCSHCYNVASVGGCCFACSTDRSGLLWFVNYHLTVEDLNRRRYPQVFNHPMLFEERQEALEEGARYVSTLFSNSHSEAAVRELTRTLRIEIARKQGESNFAQSIVATLETRYSSQSEGSMHLLVVVKPIVRPGVPSKSRE